MLDRALKHTNCFYKPQNVFVYFLFWCVVSYNSFPLFIGSWSWLSTGSPSVQGNGVHPGGKTNSWHSWTSSPEVKSFNSSFPPPLFTLSTYLHPSPPPFPTLRTPSFQLFRLFSEKNGLKFVTNLFSLYVGFYHFVKIFIKKRLHPKLCFSI